MTEQKQGATRIDLIENAVMAHSSPSDLKITDIRTAVVCSNYDYPIIRIDTNQANLRKPSGLFEPTDEWNTPKLGFWRPDNTWPE